MEKQPTTINALTNNPSGSPLATTGGTPTPDASTEGTSARHWLRNAVVH
ncbi:MAG: hypothetical protein ICV78_02345 [Tolypothrix sp. Co-bin9]|nr:hypothetical protein [Tolypothrix sp. Co-bin9]